MNKNGIIYIATNLITKKVYIGQTTTSLKERIRGHYKFAREKRNYKFSNALNKYLVIDWEWKELEINIEHENLNSRELYYISLYDSFDNGYNSTPGGTVETVRYKRGSSLEKNKIPIPLFNTNTNEIINISCYDFMNTYIVGSNSLSGAYGLFTEKYLKYYNWILLKNKDLYYLWVKENSDRSSKRFKDNKIYIFYNEITKNEFIGTRIDFMKRFNITSKGCISFLINKKIKDHKGWIIKEN